MTPVSTFSLQEDGGGAVGVSRAGSPAHNSLLSHPTAYPVPVFGAAVTGTAVEGSFRGPSP